MTSRHTKASSGIVVSMLRPKQLSRVSQVGTPGLEAVNIQSSNVDHDIVIGKVVENIAQGLVAER